MIAKIDEPLVSKKNSFKTTLKVKAIFTNGKWENSSGKILAYFQKDSIAQNIKYGNIIICKTALNEIPSPQNPSEFNYKRFLFFHRIYHQSYFKNSSYKILENSPDNGLFGIAFRLRDYLKNVFEKYNISGDEFAVASALMLGSKENIDPELMQAYASAGALHVLAVSGLHVGVVFFVLTYLLSFLDKIKYGNIFKTILQLLGLWFYALLTGLSPSVIRAATMFSFLTIGRATNRNTNIYNILACSAFFILLFNPYIIMEVGFQLSYLAVIGIIFIQPKLNRLWDAQINGAGKIGNWLITQIWAITTVSIAAQIATFPLGLLYFHQFPNYFLFSNLIVIPVSTFVIYSGVLLFAVSPVEIISNYVALVFKSLVWFLNKSVVLVEKLPYSLLQGISINLIETWLIYILIIFILAFFVQQNIKFMRFAFFIIISLLFYQIIENHFQHEQKKFIVYNINKISAYDFIDGKENFLLSDSSFINDESKILFHVRHHWWDLGISQNSFLDIDKIREKKNQNFLIKNNFIQFHDLKFVLINQNFSERKSERKLKVDYLLISGSPKISIEELKEIFDFKQIIFDSSNSNSAIKKWLEEAKNLNVNCYSVIHNGAFIIDL